MMTTSSAPARLRERAAEVARAYLDGQHPRGWHPDSVGYADLVSRIALALYVERERANAAPALLAAAEALAPTAVCIDAGGTPCWCYAGDPDNGDGEHDEDCVAAREALAALAALEDPT